MSYSKDYEEFFLLLLFGHCLRKMEEDNKNPKTLRKFNPYKIGFNIVLQGNPKNGGWL